MLVEVNNIHTSNERTNVLSEEHIEDLLSERLLDGYGLIEKNCPDCATPLVKAEHSSSEPDGKELNNPVLIPNRNPQKPFEPLDGVPICVACNAHVVTQESEMNILERREASGSELSKPDPSPKGKDAPVIDLTSLPGEEEKDFTYLDYGLRREIATSVLGSKLLQGYVLKQEQCDRCGMPQMEWKGNLDCVVCPALAKHVRKNKNAGKTESSYEGGVVSEKNLLRQQQLKKEEQELHAERESKRKMQVQAVKEEGESELRDPSSTARSHTPTMRDIMVKREQQEKLAEEYRIQQERRREEELILMEETKRLAALEEEYTVGTIRTTDVLQKDLLMDQHRNRLAAKAQLDEDILNLEQMRLVEEMEHRRMTEEKRAEEEENMLKQLEQEAAAKAKEAEEAMERAKAAREQISCAQKDIIAQTIAQAEAEVVAEAEGILKQEIEEYKEPVLLPTASEVEAEHWETLRTEGRTVMTRRVMAGWTIIAEFCRGAECEHCPLIKKGKMKECVVCGGCGDGTDGAYALGGSMDSEEDQGELIDRFLAPTLGHSTQCSTADPSIQHLENDFESKRDAVSREIGKKMLEGWTLLDGTCEACVMPLMTDAKGTKDVCVLCDLIGNQDNTSLPSQQPSSPTSRYTADPPATVPSLDESEGEMTLSIPKNFDFNDKDAVMNLINRAKGLDHRVAVEPRGYTPNDDVIDLSSYPSLDEHDESAEMIALMFLESPIGAEAQSAGSRMDLEDLLDLVAIYIKSNFGESMEDRTPEIAHAVWKKMQRDQSSSYVAEGKRRTPRAGLPPKPESRSGTPRRSRSITPKESSTSFFSSEAEDLSIDDKSSIANMQLEEILSQIERCKETLKNDDLSVDDQMEAANLIEELSKAALSVQGLEE